MTLTALPGSTNRALAVVPRLVLRHPVFTRFTDIYFRISDSERRPVMVVRLDDQEASLPIPSLMREFGISPDDEDGVMLDMAVRALGFVTGLRIGDRLPSEILTGEASWTVEEAHQDRAIARLNLQLLAYMSWGARSNSRDVLAKAGQLPLDADSLGAGLRRLAAEVPGASPDAVLDSIRRIASEFAHIEALRDELMRGAQRLEAALDRIARNFRGDGTHKELLMQVRRLASVGVADLQARFDEADTLTADIVQVVAEPDAVVASIRALRDNLFARSRAWDPFIMAWGMIDGSQSARTWPLAHETYRFLAPRFMSMMEWMAMPAGGQAIKEGQPGMVW